MQRSWSLWRLVGIGVSHQQDYSVVAVVSRLFRLIGIFPVGSEHILIFFLYSECAFCLQLNCKIPDLFCRPSDVLACVIVISTTLVPTALSRSRTVTSRRFQ